MRHYVCSVFDRKAEAYLPLFLAATKGVAVRGFVDTCDQEGHPFRKHPDDYSLRGLGEWDDVSGDYIQYGEYEVLAEAKDFVEVSSL